MLSMSCKKKNAAREYLPLDLFMYIEERHDTFKTIQNIQDLSRITLVFSFNYNRNMFVYHSARIKVISVRLSL